MSLFLHIVFVLVNYKFISLLQERIYEQNVITELEKTIRENNYAIKIKKKINKYKEKNIRKNGGERTLKSPAAAAVFFVFLRRDFRCFVTAVWPASPAWSTIETISDFPRPTLHRVSARRDYSLCKLYLKWSKFTQLMLYKQASISVALVILKDSWMIQ